MVEVTKVKRKKASEWGNTDARNRKSTRLYDTDTELAANDDDVGLVKGPSGHYQADTSRASLRIL